MTHYMELLAVNQPWNLLIFMAVPIVLAETLAITEFYLLFTKRFKDRISIKSNLRNIGWYLLLWNYYLHFLQRNYSNNKIGRMENVY